MLVPTTPRQMPDLRVELIQGWDSPAWRYTAAVNERLAFTKNPTPQRVPIPLTGVIPHQVLLADASLWWVSEEMCDLLLAAKDGVPDDVRVADVAWPDDGGLIYFARPLTGLIDSATGERSIQVDAICWGRGFAAAIPVIAVTSYRLFDLDAGLNPEELAVAATSIAEMVGGRPRSMGHLSGKLWAPLGRAEWPIEDPIGAPPRTLRQDDAIVESTQEDRRLLAAFAALVASPGIADVEETRPDRAAARRDQRIRRASKPADVRVVRVHRPPSASTGAGRDVTWSHRWPVSGHWRNARVGKGRSQRRLTWVHPYTKGPADAPLVVKETVRVLG